jgi:cell wall-associated NlpC family hydrolase
MPTRLRSPLLALAFAACVFFCAGAAPLAPGNALAGARSGEPAITASAIQRLQADPRRFVSKVVAPTPTLGERAATIALEAVGVPYSWGGSSPTSGFDCSGLVYWAYGRLGIELPHSSYALYDLGRRVAPSRVEPGDLLFFYGLGHVGLYLGRGRMVHAPQSGRQVEVVRLDRTNYGGRLVGARRIEPA